MTAQGPSPECPAKVYSSCPRCDGMGQWINGAWLRWQRKRAGVTATAVAVDLEISLEYVTHMELNLRMPSARMVRYYEQRFKREVGS